MTRRDRITTRLFVCASVIALGPGWEHRGATRAPAPAPDNPAAVLAEDLEPPEQEAVRRRRRAYERERDRRGDRFTHDLVHDDGAVGIPWSATGETPAVYAVDGDPQTAWRGSAGHSIWIWTLPFRRSVHPSLLRAAYGDASDRGIPIVYHWEYQPPRQASCAEPLPWQAVPNAAVDDQEPDQFIYGPKHVHARKQAIFLDVDACALRLVVRKSDGGAPVLREVHLLEGAPSVLRAGPVDVTSDPGPPGLPVADARRALDGDYETYWAGAPGRERWTLTIRLPQPREVDRISLIMGLDTRTVPRSDPPGRTYVRTHLPVQYVVETASDPDVLAFEPIEESRPPTDGRGLPLPVSRRLIRLKRPRTVSALRVVVTQATAATGVATPNSGVPVIREIGAYEAKDGRPVVTEPVFLSVNANPAFLTHRLRGGEQAVDEQYARDVYVRLRRSVVGFDTKTGWAPDVFRRYAMSGGRFIEAIEADDPVFDAPLLLATDPPPTVLLSGSVDWEFAPTNEVKASSRVSPPRDGRLYGWNPVAAATDEDRGLGQLGPILRARQVPIVGFCGGAHMMAMLEAERARGVESVVDLRDRVLARVKNTRIEPSDMAHRFFERAWWSDSAITDRVRPTITFDPADPMWEGLAAAGSERRSTRELPVSHVDMLRGSAFDAFLPNLRVNAWSTYCRPWVAVDGVEATTTATGQNGACVRVPQAFRSVDGRGYPLIGYQFHPEQRDLSRLVDGSPPDARGDAMNVFANMIDMVIEAYIANYWPHA